MEEEPEVSAWNIWEEREPERLPACANLSLVQNCALIRIVDLDLTARQRRSNWEPIRHVDRIERDNIDIVLADNQSFKTLSEPVHSCPIPTETSLNEFEASSIVAAGDSVPWALGITEILTCPIGA